MDKLVRDKIRKYNNEVQWRITIELKINELIEGYDEIMDRMDNMCLISTDKKDMDEMVEKWRLKGK